jgi:hypothetical protein
MFQVHKRTPRWPWLVTAVLGFAINFSLQMLKVFKTRNAIVGVFICYVSGSQGNAEAATSGGVDGGADLNNINNDTVQGAAYT